MISKSNPNNLPFQICVNCIMDTTDPEIWFNDQGFCSHCISYNNFGRPIVERAQASDDHLKSLVANIKESSLHKDYDCVLGLSGGVDSSFLAYRAKELGLRVLAVHCDAGWNSELAVKNIENIVKKLDFDLYTHVIDWEEMKDLQRSFFKASLANCDIPQDHAFLAVLHNIATKYNIKYLLNGGNVATEFILPPAWGYNAADLKHLKSVHKKFGTKKLHKYPTMGFLKRYIYYPFIKGITSVRLLDYMPYNKEEAKKIITCELDWRDYGGKHFESIFTRFFQGYYLPKKFNFDKRKAHISSLIVSQQLTREQGMQMMREDQYPEHRQKEDKEFLAKKLGLSLEEFEDIMNLPSRSYKEFPSNEWLFKTKDFILAQLKKDR